MDNNELEIVRGMADNTLLIGAVIQLLIHKEIMTENDIKQTESILKAQEPFKSMYESLDRIESREKAMGKFMDGFEDLIRNKGAVSEDRRKEMLEMLDIIHDSVKGNGVSNNG